MSFDQFLLGIILFYITTSVSHFFVQFFLAHVNYKHNLHDVYEIKKGSLEKYKINGKLPSVAVIYPIYNEGHKELALVVNSLKQVLLDIPNLKAVLVDDGSTNRADLMNIYEDAKKSGINVIFQENKGKREAQVAGFDNILADYYITVDSDTIINSESVMTLLYTILKDSEIGAVTGNVQVTNENQNLLTKLIGARYWLACNFERAAQSATGSMLCCSGPFSIYDGELIRKVKQKYLSQFFFEKKCTYGDDRNLTNLVLGEGRKTVYQSQASASTLVPTNLGEYLNQQVRWNKSFFRESIWTLKIWQKISWFSMYDMCIQTINFFIFTLVFALTFYRFLDTLDVSILYYFVITAIFMSFTKGLYGIVRTWDIKFFLTPIYFFIHILLLVPTRFRALASLSDSNWGTRSAKKQSPWLAFVPWFAAYWGFIALLVLCITFVTKNDIFGGKFNPSLDFNINLGYWANNLSNSWSLVFFLSLLSFVIFASESFIHSLKNHRLIHKLEVCLILIVGIFGIFIVAKPSDFQNNRVVRAISTDDKISAIDNIERKNQLIANIQQVNAEQKADNDKKLALAKINKKKLEDKKLALENAKKLAQQKADNDKKLALEKAELEKNQKLAQKKIDDQKLAFAKRKFIPVRQKVLTTKQKLAIKKAQQKLAAKKLARQKLARQRLIKTQRNTIIS